MMDGFASTDGPGTLGYYESSDHPFYSWVATTFAMSDRYFAGFLGPTYPSRLMMYCATSGGQTDNSALATTYNNVFRQMENHGHTWAEYVEPLSPTQMSWQDLALDWPWGHEGVLDYAHFAAAAHAGTLPQVTFLNSRTRSEHPPQSIHDGEDFVREIVTAVMSSPQWAHTALIITYDEGGGFFDHVPPPAACVPESGAPNAEDFNRLGIRRPMMLVSPYVRAGYVSPVTHTATSVTRFIQAVFDLARHDQPRRQLRRAAGHVRLRLRGVGRRADVRAGRVAPGRLLSGSSHRARGQGPGVRRFARAARWLGRLNTRGGRGH